MLATPLLTVCRPFMTFEGCLNSNSECCRSKRARYQLSHPSPMEIENGNFNAQEYVHHKEKITLRSLKINTRNLVFPVRELYLTSLWIDDLVHLYYVVALLVPLAGVLPVRVVQVQPSWTNLQLESMSQQSIEGQSHKADFVLKTYTIQSVHFLSVLIVLLPCN